VTFGTPYLIGHNTPGTPATQTITVTTATAPGDAIVVACGNSSAAGATISSVSDSKGNSYTAAIAAVTATEFGQPWTSGGQNALTTSDTITVTYSTTTGVKGAMAAGVPGANGTAVDQAGSGHASSTAPSATTAGTLSVAEEMAIGIIFNNSAGGVPSGLGSFTSAGSFQSGSSPEMTIAYQQVSATSAVTFSGTISPSNTWSAFVLTLVASGRLVAVSQAVSRAAVY
jgi:hypothetical protein